ncbi:uncharacterized protein LOC113299560 [Papaver somniferum]|uniref:uncharacterized protein LOC113299560 n=1 Tax=Papaver somniferum TaxID=3469 RepID=UPI000E6FA557|nr:uncharacterized protein LOC113299560 [Papaver somniferum]
MKGNDASHDASHVFRVRDLALSLAKEEGLSSSLDPMEIVELAALLHDIGDYKYVRDPSEEMITERFLEAENAEESKRQRILSIIKGMGDYKYVRDPSEEMITERFLEAENAEESKRQRILSIIKGMGFKEELAGNQSAEFSPEFGVVQDADRLDAIGAVGIARCFTFGGSRSRVLHDPNIHPRLHLSKGQYMNKTEQTTVNHFHEKLLKLKDLMKTKAGQRRAEKRHKFMEEFLTEFYEKWDGRS